jgi:hypothetical protein
LQLTMGPRAALTGLLVAVALALAPTAASGALYRSGAEDFMRVNPSRGIVEARVYFALRCPGEGWDQEQGAIVFLGVPPGQPGFPVDRDGRFSHRYYDPPILGEAGAPPERAQRSAIVGRVTRTAVVGRLKQIHGNPRNPVCHTGSLRNPWIRFKLHRVSQ